MFTAPLLREPKALTTNVPAVTVVVPVWPLATPKIKVPAPDLVRAPVLAAEAPVSVRLVPATVTSMVPV